jgi:hypothetical protein
MIRYNLILPAELYNKFKSICALQGMDMGIAIRKMIEEYVEKEEKKKESA